MTTLKDPFTGEFFIPKRKNQRFASALNRKNYHNANATKLNRIKAPIDNKLKNNFMILSNLTKSSQTATIEKEKMLIEGFDPNYFTHLQEYEGKAARCIYDFILPFVENGTSIKIIKNANN
jgi:hypothetical protein